MPAVFDRSFDLPESLAQCSTELVVTRMGMMYIPPVGSLASCKTGTLTPQSSPHGKINYNFN